MAEFDRQPLELDDIPQRLQKHVEPDAPDKLKMMAARGMLPAPPEQMVKILYQLHFDGDAKIRNAARDSVVDMPPNVIGPAVQNADHPGLLDWVGELHAESDEVGMVLVRNQATDDHTVATLAKHAGDQLADVIATNQVRVLRAPRIIESLYQNPSVSSATIDNLIELAQRNDVELGGLPGLSEALKSGQNLFGGKEGIDEKMFSKLLKEEAGRANEHEKKRAELEEKGEELTRSQREKLQEELESDDYDEEKDPGDETDVDELKKRGNLHAQLNEMSISQKIRLATVGSREAIKILVRDQNKLVHMAAIKSPRVKPADIKKMASNKALPENVIEYIANNRDWIQKYDVVRNLVLNPKTPLKDTMKFLKHLRMNDLRDVSRNRNVPHQVSRAAKSLMRKRRGG